MLTELETKTLERIPLLEGCPEAVSELAGLAGDEGGADFSKGDVLCTPDDFRRELCFILSGTVRVTKGAQPTTVSRLKAGDVFGAASLFNEEAEYVSTLTALESGRLLRAGAERVERMLREIPRFSMNYIRYLSGRIRFLSARIDLFAENTSERRLRAFLIRRADADWNVTLPCGMTELASALGMGRASLYRELEKLEKTGTVRREGRLIRLLNAEDL